MNRCMDVDMLIRKYIDPDIKKFSNSDVKIVLENLKQNILKAQTIEPCEDAISREAVKEEICKPTWKIANKGELIAMINFIPSVAPSRSKGERISNPDGYWICPECESCARKNTCCTLGIMPKCYIPTTNTEIICPNCGSNNCISREYFDFGTTIKFKYKCTNCDIYF